VRERLAAANPDVADRIVFLPRMSRRDYLALAGCADVALDPPHFGGGNTSYEIFAAGTPIVTWPSAYLRGRITAAQYGQMGLGDEPDLVVPELGGYAEAAARLGADPERREAVRAEILGRNHELYEDAGAVRELEAFFERALRAGGPA
jgi:predicted O-linked N-acetylglucosamine transferase (SPINDLY family)